MYIYIYIYIYMYLSMHNIIIYTKQEVQLQWTPPPLAFKSQRVRYQSNQKLLHHYQHLKNHNS